MVEIGGKPILWHIMKIYSHYGYNKFILALGYRGEYIKEYFYNYRILCRDFTMAMDPHKSPEMHDGKEDCEWEITFVDGVADIDINKLHSFHLSHKGIGTVTAVRPPSRFGELALSGNKVTDF